MRRILPTLILAAILLGACAPTVTHFTPEPVFSPGATPTSKPLPAVRTLVPTATNPPDLGANLDELRGLQVLVWHAWDGAAAGLFAQMAAEFTLSNKWGIQVKVVSRPNLNILAAEVDNVLDAPERPDIVVTLPEQILTWQENMLDFSPYLAQPENGLDAGDASGAFWEQS